MIELIDDDVNKLFKIVSDIAWQDKKFTFTEEMLEKFDYYNDEQRADFQKLIGYHVELEVDGDHRTDGQFVDYTINLTSPTGEETTIETEMCLMVGWDYDKDEIIK